MNVEYKHSDITGRILKAAYEVYNNLGYGFLEKVYENALFMELKTEGLTVEKQYPIKVYYKSKIIGEYYADLVVDKKVIVELKAVSNIEKSHEVQLVNYLKATEIEVGLLINFGQKIQHIRRIFDL